MKNTPLSREQLISVIDGRSVSPRVPMIISFWVFYPDRFGDRKEELLRITRSYPTDAQMLYINMPQNFRTPGEDPEYRWFHFEDPYKDTNVALDQRIALSDWDQLDEVLRHLPDPCYEGLFKYDRPADGRYRLGFWWFSLFERQWSWRGMTNALMDFYDHPDQIHRMFRAITDFYLTVIERAHSEMHLDGIMISDDLGHQKNTFFSTGIFEEFFSPYYREMIDKAHSLGMHLWLHSCGCIESFLPLFVEMGLDVIHPIQKHTSMDYRDVAERFGSKITVWAGLDVQQVIPWGTPEEVRQEVRLLIDTFHRPEGRLIMAAGNALNEDCPLSSLEAFLDETYRYGSKVVQGRSDSP